MQPLSHQIQGFPAVHLELVRAAGADDHERLRGSITGPAGAVVGVDDCTLTSTINTCRGGGFRALT